MLSPKHLMLAFRHHVSVSAKNITKLLLEVKSIALMVMQYYQDT